MKISYMAKYIASFFIFSFYSHGALIELDFSFDSLQYRMHESPDPDGSSYTLFEKSIFGKFSITIDDSATPISKDSIIDNDYMYRKNASTSFYSPSLNVSEIPFSKEYTDEKLVNGDISQLNNMSLSGGYVLQNYKDPLTQDTYLYNYDIGGYIAETVVEVYGDVYSGTYSSTVTSTHINRSVGFRLKEALGEQPLSYPSLENIIHTLKSNPVYFITGVYHSVQKNNHIDDQIVDQQTFTTTTQLSGTAQYISVDEPSTILIFLFGILLFIRQRRAF